MTFQLDLNEVTGSEKPQQSFIVQYTRTVTVRESCLRSVQFVWCLKLLTVRKEKYTVRKEEYTIRICIPLATLTIFSAVLVT